MFLFITPNNPKSDTISLEKEIAQMLYALYRLSKEVIAIVENSKVIARLQSNLLKKKK